MYSIGDRVVFDLYGKSHAPCIGCTLTGLPAGIPIDMEELLSAMELRKPKDKIGTPRKEKDLPEIGQGIVNGVTDGNPIKIEIKNGNTDGSKYLKFAETPRPGHADLPALAKFPDHDVRGGGQFSGRLTAIIVAAGNICQQFIRRYGITVSAHVKSIADVEDTVERDLKQSLESRIYSTRACTKELDEQMFAAIDAARMESDSVGGIVQCITEGLPIGFGGIWFDALDALIAKAMFGIPACKGIEFGKGYQLTKMRGSQSNDPFYYDEGIKVRTNNMGGILGGMSDGAPMIFDVAFKPTPSIGKEQDTVNLKDHCNAKVTVEGRHDPCIVPRAAIVVETMTAIVIADEIMKEAL